MTAVDHALFPRLTSYGNYTEDDLPIDCIHRIPLDGTIRHVKRLGIPFVPIVCVDLAFGRTYKPRLVGYAIPAHERSKLVPALRAAKRHSQRAPSPHPDLILCAREASKEAHRSRDEASGSYELGQYHWAGHWSAKKREWYRLKDRGIIAAHRAGLLNYIGASPQGMAVYEYGQGGMQCFHSTLHPAGVVRTPIEGHPETLLVAAREKARGISLRRVKATLSSLPEDTTGYERSAPPRIERRGPTCWECGEEGHIARHCPDRNFIHWEEGYPANFGVTM